MLKQISGAPLVSIAHRFPQRRKDAKGRRIMRRRRRHLKFRMALRAEERAEPLCVFASLRETIQRIRRAKRRRTRAIVFVFFVFQLKADATTAGAAERP